MKEVSNKFLDRPLSPMDEACYWVEYIIRHGNKALRSPALEFSWWQIALLDIYFTLLIIGIVISFMVIYLIQFIMNITHRKKSKNPNTKKFN